MTDRHFRELAYALRDARVRIDAKGLSVAGLSSFELPFTEDSSGEVQFKEAPRNHWFFIAGLAFALMAGSVMIAAVAVADGDPDLIVPSGLLGTMSLAMIALGVYVSKLVRTASLDVGGGVAFALRDTVSRKESCRITCHTLELQSVMMFFPRWRYGVLVVLWTDIEAMVQTMRVGTDAGERVATYVASLPRHVRELVKQDPRLVRKKVSSQVSGS